MTKKKTRSDNRYDISRPIKQMLETEKLIVKAAERLEKYLESLPSGMMDRIMSDRNDPEVNVCRNEVSRLLDDVMDAQAKMQKQAENIHSVSSEMRRRMNLTELMREEKELQLREERKQDLTKEIAAKNKDTSGKTKDPAGNDKKVKGMVLDNGEDILLPEDQMKSKAVTRRKERRKEMEKQEKVKSKGNGPAM